MSVWKAFRPADTPYPASLTLASDETIIVSGLSGHTPDGGIADNIYDQAAQAMRNVEALLRRAGSSLDEVVIIRPYVTDIASAEQLRRALLAAFGEALPASSALLGNVTLASPEMLVELECVAVRGATRVLETQ